MYSYLVEQNQTNIRGQKTYISSIVTNFNASR